MKAAGQSITLTLFRDAAATSKAERVFLLPALADTIRARTAPQKTALPWLKAARFGEQRTAKGSLRHDANMLAIAGIEGDYDGERMPFDAACELLERQGIASVVYTSPSHTEDAPRWRVLCPLSEEMPPGRRNHQIGRLNGLFRGIFSIESWTLSQSYYFGSINQNPSHQVEFIEGLPIDAHDDLDTIWLGKAAAQSGTMGEDQLAGRDAREDAELIRCVVTGEHFHVELCALAARYVGRGIPGETAGELLRGIMLSHPIAARDERWLDRYYSISELVASAEQKYRGEVARQRRELARLACHLIRERRPSQEVRTAILARAAVIGTPNDQAERIIDWAARQELARRASEYA